MAKDYNSKVQHETIHKDREFDLINYGTNLNKQLNYVLDKIEEAERKITSLKTKEKIIDDMITRTNTLVEDFIAAKNYKLSGINQGHILTQFETLAQVQEMLIKYEDMIQKYIKMSIDIENHKMNAYTKLTSAKKEDKMNDEGYEKLMSAMHGLVSDSKQDSKQDSPQMLDAVRDQLKLEGY
ncbi:MAG: hypothetical protein DRG78_08395 [Epsilonproteobacteria bacterium]|nr:MAG: hypothetical protein DRG78_08395 [Campylobacterota bacterium]